MLEDALKILAVTGGTTVTAAMATDAWKTAKAGMTRLFRRRGFPDPSVIEDQMDSSSKLVLAAGDPERVRTILAPLWQDHFEALLLRHPDAAAEIEHLLDEIRAELPEPGERWVQHNIARGHGQVFAAQGGNVILHGTPEGEQNDS